MPTSNSPSDSVGPMGPPLVLLMDVGLGGTHVSWLVSNIDSNSMVLPTSFLVVASRSIDDCGGTSCSCQW